MIKPIESERFKAAHAGLPDTLRSIFQQMVEEYSFLVEIKTGRGWVAYDILADMVRAGWRPSAERTEDSKL